MASTGGSAREHREQCATEKAMQEVIRVLRSHGTEEEVNEKMKRLTDLLGAKNPTDFLIGNGELRKSMLDTFKGTKASQARMAYVCCRAVANIREVENLKILVECGWIDLVYEHCTTLEESVTDAEFKSVVKDCRRFMFPWVSFRCRQNRELRDFCVEKGLVEKLTHELELVLNGLGMVETDCILMETAGDLLENGTNFRGGPDLLAAFLQVGMRGLELFPTDRSVRSSIYDVASSDCAIVKTMVVSGLARLSVSTFCMKINEIRDLASLFALDFFLLLCSDSDAVGLSLFAEFPEFAPTVIQLLANATIGPREIDVAIKLLSRCAAYLQKSKDAQVARNLAESPIRILWSMDSYKTERAEILITIISLLPYHPLRANFLQKPGFVRELSSWISVKNGKTVLVPALIVVNKILLEERRHRNDEFRLKMRDLGTQTKLIEICLSRDLAFKIAMLAGAIVCKFYSVADV